jgi:hypothetical protein
LRLLPSNPPERMQHFLKSAAGPARTEIVASELLNELFLAVHDAVAALDMTL